MSNINISLSANTAAYVQRLKTARTETDRNLILIEKRVDSFASQISKDFTSINGAINAAMGGLKYMRYGGFVAGAGAITFAAISVTNALNEMGRAAVENQSLLVNGARAAKMTVQDFSDTAATLSTAGISVEQFGDISKDVFDKMGEYVTTGSGAFQDFFDVVGKETDVTIKDLEKLSSIEVFQTMYTEMEKTGASAEQMRWVFESLGNDASKFMHLLKDGGKEYQRLVDKMSRTKVQLLGSTVEDIQSLDASMNAAASNFEVYMTERFSSVSRMFDKLANEVSDWFAEETEKIQGEDIQVRVANGKYNIDSIGDSEKAKQDLDVIDKQIKAQELLLSKKKASYEQDKKAGKLTNYSHSRLVEMNKIQGEINALKRTQLSLQTKKDELTKEENTVKAITSGDSDLAKVNSIDAQLNQREKMMEDALAKFEELDKKLNEYDAKYNEAMSKGDVDAVDKYASMFNGALDNRNAALGNLNIHIAEYEKLEADKLDAVNKAERERLNSQIKYSQDRAAQARAAHKLELFDLEKARIVQSMTDEEYAKNKLNLEKRHAEDIANINKSKLNETRALEDQRYNAALTFAIDGNAKLNAQYAIDLLNLNRALEDKKISQSLYDANIKQLAITKAADEKAIEFKKQNEKLEIQRTFATTSSAEREASLEQELLQIEEYRGQEGITDEMILNKKADLRREARQAQLDEDLAFMESDAERNLIKAEADLEMLRMQLENEDVTKDEFRVQEIEKEKALADAKRAVQYEHLGMMADVMAGVSGLAKEGSTAQKVLFAAEKAATIAQMTIKMEETAAAAKLAAMKGLSGPAAVAAGEAAAMKERIMGGASIAKVVATSIGQFHNGGEVDQTGSYILKAGERVVAPDTNKELKSFLKESHSSNTGANINAPLNIQGDTTISEARLTAMMAKQRDSIAKMVRLAERENPSLR